MEQNRWRGGGLGGGGSMLMPVYREISHCDPITISLQGRVLLMQRVLLLFCKLFSLSCEVRTHRQRADFLLRFTAAEPVHKHMCQSWGHREIKG